MAGTEPIKVRLKMTPWRETVLKGGERELADLKALGAVYEGSAETDEGAARAVEQEQAKAAEAAAAAAKKKEN